MLEELIHLKQSFIKKIIFHLVLLTGDTAPPKLSLLAGLKIPCPEGGTILLTSICLCLIDGEVGGEWVGLSPEMSFFSVILLEVALIGLSGGVENRSSLMEL